MLWSSRAWRRRPQCDAEAVLHQAGLEARSVAAFLHENVLEFVAEEGIDSAADVMAYLSDAGMPRFLCNELPTISSMQATHLLR